ncbi:hypothetical protein DXG03_005804 [Asterophora parasitica]|uniref:Autophagy-related protein 17 n=1 Tax=Asterophora parasitica TaxID=117018 RepID=A0A9P7G9P5_9AGAR|nr:hypothetical protein DXG03_005804 [Asterophora parasitica]
MSSPPAQPPLVSLVLESKKALQNGELLCSRAHAVSNASANTSIDVVALDAKVRWVTEAVGEQLKLVVSVAKSIEEKRAHLEKQVQEWDKLRAKHSNALDNVLESLGSQLVPPDFHTNASEDSSLFGSQHSDDEHEHTSDPRKSNGSGGAFSAVSQSPSSTLRIGLRNLPNGKERERGKRADKRLWKTLRDFVDDQAIEDVLEAMEDDRLGLDYIMSKTDEYPETLANTTTSIQDALPVLSPEPPMKFAEEVLAAQDVILTSMAAHLGSLTSHYDQMANALQDTEAGEEFSEEDLHGNECTNEKLQATKEMSQSHLSLLAHTLDDLDELGDIMVEMLRTQEEVEAKFEEELNGLQNHLLTIEHLHDRFVSYQTAFNKLILELARRRQYREAAENIVKGMTAQLEAMAEEENAVRSHFNADHGAHLPEDLCLCVGNAPTRWEVVPWSGDALEFLPIIDSDLITEAKDRIHAELEKSPGGLGAESM